MADRMYAEQRKYALWIIKSALVAMAVSYILGLLALPVELWCWQGLDRETFGAAFEFWKTASWNPVRYFTAYVKWWRRFQTSPFSIGLFVPFIPILTLIGIFVRGVLKNPYKNMPNIFGEGRLATLDDIKSMSNIVGLDKGICTVLGRFKGHLMKLNETLSVLACAPPGAGKTAGVVVPTIFESDGVSIIVNDPKPELCFSTSGYRSTLGPVFIINWGKADDPEKGVFYPSWNPLSPECLPPLGPARDMYIDSMNKILVAEPTGGQDPHWSNTGRNAMAGLLHFIASKCERARANDYFVTKLQEGSFDAEDGALLETYYLDMEDMGARMALDALRRGALTLANYAPVGTWDGLPQSWYGCEPCVAMMLEWWTDMQMRMAAEIKRRSDEGDQMAMMADPMKDVLDAAVNECRRFGYARRAIMELNQLSTTPDKERGSIISTAFAGINIFKNSAVVARTKKSDFTFRDLRGIVDPATGKMKPVSVYLSVDLVDAAALSVITGIFVELMSNFLIANPPNHVGTDGLKAGPYPVLFVLDEFPQMPKLTAVKDGPALGRGMKVAYLLIGQDLGQITGKYGKDDLETIISTTAVKIVLSQNNEQTAKRFVEMVGNTTIEVKSTSRQEGMNAPQGSMFTQNVSRQMQQSTVIQTADIMSLDPLQQYVLVQSHMSRPILADSPRYYLDAGMQKKVSMKPCGNIPQWIADQRMAEWRAEQERIKQETAAVAAVPPLAEENTLQAPEAPAQP
ncbi:MAG: type IV secretory system conjugative DNA transfer family protein [Alphaproteobacteria bacterium]|nr:type IV secretory system conjugative DNA transfer family protein [Alphaproteobacteria bacterium]